MPNHFGPTERPDSAPLHENVIRRFREELRLDRGQFSELLDVNIDTLRVWESGSSKPRGPAALKIVQVAKRNQYPMTIEEIYEDPPPKKKRAKKKKSNGRAR